MRDFAKLALMLLKKYQDFGLQLLAALPSQNSEIEVGRLIQKRNATFELFRQADSRAEQQSAKLPESVAMRELGSRIIETNLQIEKALKYKIAGYQSQANKTRKVLLNISIYRSKARTANTFQDRA